MHIGIDARQYGARGMGTYTRALVRALLARAGPGQRYSFYTTRALPAAELAATRAAVGIIRLPALPFPLREQVAWPLWLRYNAPPDLIHFTLTTSPVYRPDRTRTVVTVHDLIHSLPASVLPPASSPYQRFGRLYRRVICWLTLQRADAIITVSHHSRADLLARFPCLAGRVHVVHEAADPRFRPLPPARPGDQAGLRRRLGLSGPFVLHLGGIDPRKNTRRTITAFAQGRRRADQPLQLVIVGIPAGARASFQAHSARLGVAEAVVLADYVADEELIWLYNRARAVLYPSLYEGFGLPVLEAMACGVPVVAGNVASVPEIAGEGAFLVEPRRTAAIAEGLVRCLGDESLRAALVARGQARAADFSWERAALETHAVYEGVLGR